MNAEVYEAMLSQGWRRYAALLEDGVDYRSGRYMYKHNLKHTCCRLYPVCANVVWLLTADSARGEVFQG